jgi:Fic family protein
MFIPSYQLTSEAIYLVSEISEQIGILETLTGNTSKTPEESFDPFQEGNLLRAHEKMTDGLSDGSGQYINNDPRVRLHMSMLFDWLNHTEEHPLIRSCIFHYELTSIHPFSEGNERLGLYWQTLLLAQWRPVLSGLSVESVVVERQQEYRRVLAYYGEIAKTSHFIEFILRCILDTVVREVKNKVENKVKNKSRGKVQDNTSENTLEEDVEAQLSKSEQRVVKLLTADPRITIGTLSHRLQLSEAGINKVLAGLRKKGIIERVGANKNGSWKVNV